MYSNIPLNQDVLGRVALAMRALPAYACYHYTLPVMMRAVHFCDGEVQASIDMYNHAKSGETVESTPSKTNCPCGYIGCSGCGRCEW